MSYIGNSITQQSFTGGVDQYNGNNSNTVFGLTRTINTVYDVDAYVENVWQRPTTGYTVSANTITFTSAPPAGSNNVVVVYRNFSATSIVPQQGSVTHTAFAANAVPTALGYIPANKAGDTFSGAVSGITTLAAGNTTITGTLSASANVNFDSGTFFVDGTNNRVGINNTAPGNSLTVATATNVTIIEAFANSGSTTIGTNGNAGVFNTTASDGIRFRMNGTDEVAIDGSTLSLSGLQGIKFQATQNASSDANTLDDYEEGTWTPTFDTSGGNTFTQSGTGIYTKIGRNVTASGIINWTAKSGGAGVNISLPFATISTGGWRGGVTYGTITNMTFVSATKIITASLDPSSSYFSLRYANNGATWSALTPSDMQTSGEFQFTAVYPI